MAEKFRKIVAAPEQAAKKLREMLEGTQPAKYVRTRRREKVDAGKINKHAGARDAAAIAGLKTLKWSAWLAAGGAQFMLWMARVMALDNSALRKMEEKYAQMDMQPKKVKDKKTGETKVKNPGAVKKFAQKYPNLSAHITWYFALATLVGGGYTTYEIIDGQEKSIFKNEQPSIDNFVINPDAPDEAWNSQISAIHPYVVMNAFLTEGFIRDAYYDNGKNSGTLTIGIGFTINDKKHRDFAKRILGRPLGNGSRVTVEESRRLTDAWLLEEIYPKMRKHLHTKMSARTFISLAITAYNAGENTYAPGNSGAPVCKAVNSGKSKEEIANVLVQQFGKIRGTQWPGMPNKYAVCALYMLGDVSDEAILNSIGEAPYALDTHLKQDEEYLAKFNNKTMEKGKLLIYSSQNKKAKPTGFIRLDNINELLQKQKYRVTKGTKQVPNRECMTEYEVQTILAGKVFGNNVIDYRMAEIQQSASESKMTDSEKLNEEGEEFFFDKKYDKAIRKFEDALKADEKNYIVYSNLSIAFYKNGKYEQGLKVVQDLITSNLFADMPRDVRAYTYYNAGLCREKLGDLETDPVKQKEHYNKARANYKLAVSNGSKNVQYKVDNMNKKISGIGKNKKTAFNLGMQKMNDNVTVSDACLQVALRDDYTA